MADEKKYLDQNGLNRVFTKLKSLIDKKIDAEKVEEFYIKKTGDTMTGALSFNGKNSISSDGSTYTGKAATAGKADDSTRINGCNLAIVTEVPNNPEPNTIYIRLLV